MTDRERDYGDETMFPTPEEDEALAREIMNRPERDMVEIHGVLREVPGLDFSPLIPSDYPTAQELEDRDMADALSLVKTRWPLNPYALEWLTAYRKGDI